MGILYDWFIRYTKKGNNTSLKSPIYVYFELTDRCNLFCRHCYRFDNEKVRKSFDINDRKIMILAKKIVKSGILSVVLTGGEPFEKKELLLKVVKYFRKNNLVVSINTNLLLIDEKTISELERMDINGILISCVSSDPDTYKALTCGGSFQKFKDNLKLINKYKISYRINMVITKKNLSQVRKTASDLKELGITNFSATPMTLTSENPRKDLQLSVEEIRVFIKDLIWIKDYLKLNVDIMEPLPLCTFPKEIFLEEYPFINRRCDAGTTSIGITNTGEVKPCLLVNKVYGNLLNESLIKIFKEMEQWRDRSLISKECLECKVLDKCGSGCRANALAFDENLKENSPWYTRSIENIIFKNTQSSLEEITLNEESILSFPSSFSWRKETKNKYLILTGRNIRHANRKQLELIKVLKGILPLKLKEVTKIFNISSDNQAFLKAVRFLYEQKIINIQ